MLQTEMSVHDLLLRLLETLGSLWERTHLFTEVLAQERLAIKTLAIDQLTTLNETKCRLIQELTAYDGVRMDQVRQLAALWKIPAESLTIGQIADRVGGAVAQRLKQQQGQLNQTILDARHSNQVTGILLQKSLGFLHGAVSIMRTPFDAQLPLYSETGSMQAAGLQRGLLERRG